jgi:outer membrane receptor protein involved in Fe transport
MQARLFRIIILFITIVTAFTTTVHAQDNKPAYQLNGAVQDSINGKPIAYATITLYDSAGNNIASTYSLESGAFKTQLSGPGAWRLDISMVGYRTKSIHITISQDQPIQPIYKILLTAGSDELQAVVVSARKRLVEQKPGMLVYNADNDITNKGGTAADVLRKAPVLNVDAQGNVSMRGSSNLKILINGKYSGQMARSAADALNMMPAAMIRSVEIITTPSAKYDAEGAAGVINIITKKGKKDLSGTLETSISNLEQMLNPRLSMATGKWNINLAGHIHRLRNKSATLTDRTSFSGGNTINRLQQQVDEDNAAPHGSADLSIDYTIDEVSELSLGVNAWLGRWPDDNRVRSVVYAPGGQLTEQYGQNITSSSAYLGADINLGYNRKLKKAGQQLTLLLQSSPSRDISKYNALQLSPSEALLYRERNDSKTKNREWTFQVDYAHPLNAKGTLNLEVGGKAIFRNVNNRYDVKASDPQQPYQLIPQPDRSDNFRYSQDVMAGYGMLKINLPNNWYIESGARIEATYIDGRFTHAGTGIDNQFVNFVPTATLSKKLDEHHSFNLSYTKRLTRPYIWDLNPNVDASDPKNLESGNPNLQPEIAHQAELSYGLNTGQTFFMNAAIFWKQTDNAIVDFMSTNAEGISFANKQNLAANRQWGLNLSATSNISEHWSMNGNVNVNYFDYSSSALDIFRSGWGTDVNINSTLKLPRNFSLQVFGDYNTRAITLLGTGGRIYYYSFAGKKEIKKARLTITLAAINPFTQYIAQTDQKQRPDFISTVDNRFYNRAFKLTINWEFGGKLRQSERKKIDNNDVNVQGKG